MLYFKWQFQKGKIIKGGSQIDREKIFRNILSTGSYEKQRNTQKENYKQT